LGHGPGTLAAWQTLSETSRSALPLIFVDAGIAKRGRMEVVGVTPSFDFGNYTTRFPGTLQWNPIRTRILVVPKVSNSD